MPLSFKAGYNRVPVRSSDPAIYAKQVVQMVRDRANHSREDSEQYRRKVSKWYDLYRGFVRARSQPFRNQVHLPLLFSSIEAGVAIKHGLLTGSKPHAEFMPGGPEDSQGARRTTALVQQQFDDCNTEGKLADLLRMGDISGTAPFQWSWKRVTNLRPQRVPDPMDPTGMAFQVINQEITDFDGPWWEPVDVLDWFPEPGKTDIRTMGWCIRRYWMDLDDVMELVEQGVYDQEGVKELSMAQMTDEGSAEYENRRTAPGSLRWGAPNVSQMDKYAKPVEILEMHGVVPNELVSEDNFRNRLITVGNGIALLRNVGNPIWTGGLPFGVYRPIPDPYTIYGIGKVEPNDKLQATASRFASQKLDVLDLIIDPALIYNQLANVQTGKLFNKPGVLIGVDGPPLEAIAPVPIDFRCVQVAIQDIEQLWRWIQFGTGITEEAVGMSGPAGGDRQTAREFLGKMENVQRRIVSETMGAARDVVMPLAEAFRTLDAQFLPFPTIVRKLGRDALIDPLTGQPTPPDQSVTLQDVALRYDMRAESATSLVGRSAKQQNVMLLLQAIAAVPPLMMQTNWMTVARMLWRTFEEPNVDEFILPINPQQILMQMMATQAAGQPAPDSSGKVPGSPTQPNAPGDTMDQMVTPAGAEQYS